LHFIFKINTLLLSRCIINLIFITMSSYRQLLYHIVFRTKNGMPSINPEHADQLFSYITGIIKNKNSHLYRINGTENHLHILTDLHPSYALSDFIRELKVSTSVWMKERGLFPSFDGWADGYGSFRAERSGGFADLRFHRRLFTYRHICGFLVETVPRFIRCI